MGEPLKAGSTVNPEEFMLEPGSGKRSSGCHPEDC